MGNKSTKQQSSHPATHGKMMNDTKNVLLLHDSSQAQLKTVRNFRDALVTKANGSIRPTVVNITLSKDLSWLDEINNVIVICLTPEALPKLEQVCREKQFIDENGHLHVKVFTVSFGNNLTSALASKGITRNVQHVRDFSFGFEQVDMLKPSDFEISNEMTSLVSAINGTN